MNILHTLLILAFILGCGGIVSTDYNNKNINLEKHMVRDIQACSDTNNIWKTLTSSYEIGERTIDNFNSITFQSLSTDVYNIVLYYKNTVNTIQYRPDSGMDIKVDDVPKQDGTIDEYKGFIIQANQAFFNSGYYYVRIDKLCYRGEFPKNDAIKNEDIYKNVKLVVN